MKAPLASTLTLLSLAACSSMGGMSPTPGAEGFDGATTGWLAAWTGGFGPQATFMAKADDGAVSAPNVLALTEVNHESEARFNLYWQQTADFQDGYISLAVRGDDGAVDQGGGPMWRVQDENNYYVCRFNPLELNYRVYVVDNGVRRQLGTAIADVEIGKWHRVEVLHEGDHIVCSLDGKPLLDVRDNTITKAGGVGLWTKADARTSFDDLTVMAKR
ncbi:MAG: DUF1080 domain-containing protein [bacterium]|nr:DUF1080 domain-containing protein [bacterium]